VTPDPLLAALVAGLVAAALGLLVPRVVAALPESGPDPEEEEPAGRAAPAKLLYVELAARPHLAVACAVVAGSLAAALGASRGWRPDLPVWIYLSLLGTTLGYIDWRTRLLPKRLVIPSYFVVAVLLAIASAVDWADGGREALIRAGISWLAVFAIHFALWFVYPRGLGYGDVRLSGILGMALGWLGTDAVLAGLYAGWVLGALIAPLLALAKVVNRKEYPFGPFLLVGTFLGVLHADGHLFFWT